MKGVRVGRSMPAALNKMADRRSAAADFCNKIGTFRTCRDFPVESAFGGKAEVGFRASQRQLLAQSGRSPNLVSGAILSCDSAARLVAICPLPTDPGWLEHDLLQAIATGDDDHEVEFALLLHQTSSESASLCSFLGDAHGV